MIERTDTKKENEKNRPIVVEGWCAFNKADGKPLIDEMSFERTRELAYKRWRPKFYGQVIRKCRVIIDAE